MNIARSNHSSCVLKSNLYCFGGLFHAFSTVEVLDIESNEQWLLVHLPDVSPRDSALFCPISENLIAIIGGYGKKHMSDIALLDV